MLDLLLYAMEHVWHHGTKHCPPRFNLAFWWVGIVLVAIGVGCIRGCDSICRRGREGVGPDDETSACNNVSGSPRWKSVVTKEQQNYHPRLAGSHSFNGVPNNPTPSSEGVSFQVSHTLGLLDAQLYGFHIHLWDAWCCHFVLSAREMAPTWFCWIKPVKLNDT